MGQAVKQARDFNDETLLPGRVTKELIAWYERQGQSVMAKYEHGWWRPVYRIGERIGHKVRRVYLVDGCP